MIDTHYGMVRIEGSLTEIKADLTVAIKCVFEAIRDRDGEEVAKSEINSCVEDALKYAPKSKDIADDDDELVEKRLEKLKKLIEGLEDLMKDEDK